MKKNMIYVTFTYLFRNRSVLQHTEVAMVQVPMRVHFQNLGGIVEPPVESSSFGEGKGEKKMYGEA